MMIPTRAELSTDLRKWERARFRSYLYYTLKSVWETPYAYPPLFLAVIIFYAEYVFFSAYLAQAGVLPSPAEAGSQALVQAILAIETWGYILVLYFIVAFTHWAFRLRSRVIIEPFAEDDDTQRHQTRLDGPIHTLLVYDLNHIAKLYCDVDNKRPISTTLSVVSSPSVNVIGDDVSDMIGKVVTTDTSIEIGFLKIPVHVLLGFFGKFFSGKRIQGSLLCSKDELILIASMKNYVWEVRCSCLAAAADVGGIKTDSSRSPPDEGALIREMIEEMACKIFSDLTEFQSFRHEATREFMKGIESYRACLLSPGNKIEKLLEAEKSFSNSLSLDTTFSMAWYNLGAVYTELKFFQAAKVAFFKSFSHKRTKGNAYYAFALNDYLEYIGNPAYGEHEILHQPQKYITRLKDAEFLCDHAETLLKNDPKVPLLLGRLNLELYYLHGGSSSAGHFPNATGDPFLEKAIQAFRKSAEYSYLLWEREEYRSVSEQLVSLPKGTLTGRQLHYHSEVRERLGELGWAYLEYAVREKITAVHKEKELVPGNSANRNKIQQVQAHAWRSRDALNASLEIFCESLFNAPSLAEGTITEDDICRNLHIDVPDPLEFWKCGIVQICRNDYASAELLLSRALVVNPNAFLYQASHIIGRIFKPRQDESAKDLMRGYWIHTIQRASTAFDLDRTSDDRQWWYLAEAISLIGKMHYPEIQRPEQGEKPQTDYNMFATLVEAYTGCGEFGKFVNTVFGIYEILLICDDENKFFSLVGVSPNEFSKLDEHKLPSEILKGLRDRIWKKMGLAASAELITWPGYLADHEPWIEAMINYTLGRQLLKRSDPEKADEIIGYFEAAKRCLADLYPLQPIFWKIDAMEVIPLMNKESHREALALAWRGHWNNPTSDRVHLSLGGCEITFDDYENAIKHWSEGLRYKSEPDWNITDIATAYLYLSRTYPFDPDNPYTCRQDEYLREAENFLKKSLVIAEFGFQSEVSKELPRDSSGSDNKTCQDNLTDAKDRTAGNPEDAGFFRLTERESAALDNLISLNFWLGQIYLERAEFSKAVLHLKVVKNLCGSCSRSEENLGNEKADNNHFDCLAPASFWLGYGLYKQGKNSEAKIELQKILVCSQVSGIMRMASGKQNITFSKKQKLLLKTRLGKRIHLARNNYCTVLCNTLLLLARIEIEQFCPEEYITDLIRQIMVFLSSSLKIALGSEGSSLNDVCTAPAPTGNSSLDEILAEVKKVQGLYYLKRSIAGTIDEVKSGSDKKPVPAQGTQEDLDTKELDQAITLFQNAFRFSDDEEIRIFLIIAYHRKIQIAANPKSMKKLLAALEYHLQMAKQYGIPREYTDTFKRIRTDFQTWSKTGNTTSSENPR